MEKETVSENTLNPITLIFRFHRRLSDEWPERAEEIRDNHERLFETLNEDNINYVWEIPDCLLKEVRHVLREEIMSSLNERAQIEGFRFGAAEKEKTKFGFWKIRKEDHACQSSREGS